MSSSNNKRRGEEEQQTQNQRRGSDQNRKHLYVALDDWNKGFSIYKIDADSFTMSDDESSDLQHLDAPLLRLESPVGDLFYGVMSFSAMGGTKMLASMNNSCGLIYDIETGVVAMGPHAPQQQLVSSMSTYIRVGERLYALSRHAEEKKYSLFVMSWGQAAACSYPIKPQGWSWKPLPSPPPAFDSRIASYALHPDGRTIFITTNHRARECTYTFDTERSVWTWHGDWALPFQGQGHFDTELDAWVGLCFDGSVCSCQAVPPTVPPSQQRQQLHWKMTEEKLVHDRIVSNRFLTASLTHLGRTKFCLVQTLARSRQGRRRRPLGCVLQITMFRLKYTHKGQLQTSSKHRFTRSFLVSTKHRNYIRPSVMWM